MFRLYSTSSKFLLSSTTALVVVVLLQAGGPGYTTGPILVRAQKATAALGGDDPQGTSSRAQHAPSLPGNGGEFETSKTTTPPSTARSPSSSSRTSFALLGRIVPFLWRLVITPDEARHIWSVLSRAINPGDLFALTLVGWATLPIFRIGHGIASATTGDDDGRDPQRGKGMKVSSTVSTDDTFQRTWLFTIAQCASQLAKIGTAVYAFDCLSVVLPQMGFTARSLADGSFSRSFAKVCYTVWLALRVKKLKRHVITRSLARHLNLTEAELDDEGLGKAVVFDHLANFVLYSVTLLILLEELSFHVGVALSSLFAFGGAGTLVLGLAAKDMATLLISGLVLSMSNKFHEGEMVKLGDGTSGRVVKLDWTDTTIRGSDNVWVKIPNNQLTGQRVYNLSRITQSQVKQNIRFKYADASKIPAIIEDIKEEIRRVSSPWLITDGSRPFRVHWTNYEDDHVLVTLDLHFNIKPVGDAYWDNRQAVMEAIYRAVGKNRVDFAETTACASSPLNECQ